MVPPKGVTTNSFDTASRSKSEELTALFSALQEWEEVLAASDFEPEEFDL